MADQVYQLVISYDSSGRFCQNVLHFKFDDGGFSSTLDAASALIDAWQTAHLDELLDLLPDSVTVISLKSRRVSNGQGFEFVKLLTSGNLGNRTGDMAVSGAGPVIVGYPANQQLRSRSRLFIPGITVTDTNIGVISEAAFAVFDGAAQAFFTTFALTGGGAPTATPVIKKATPAASIAIVAGQISTKIGTQRRRQRPL